MGLAGTLFAQPPPDATVATDGSGQYTSLQDAISAAPMRTGSTDPRWVIFVKAGTYRERVYVQRERGRIAVIGEDAEKTILTYDLNANLPGPDGKPIGTFRTPTLQVDGDGMIWENLTIANDAGRPGPRPDGPPVAQALALRADGDRLEFRHCRFLGWQDTILVNRGRHYFADCYIEGHVDFIFGAATAYFDRCHIHCLKDGYITAASTPEGQPDGFVFADGKITGVEGVKTYLGRPWRNYARTVFLRTEMSAVVRAEGWHNWNKPDAEKTTHYAEFGSTGSGAAPGSRVPWARSLTLPEAKALTVQLVLGGPDHWSPAADLGALQSQLNSGDEKTLALPKFSVNEHAGDDQYDATGMGGVEEELRSSPFSNELTAVDLEMEQGLGAEISTELAAISSPSPAAAAAGEERLNLRGFPTPILRNGFTLMGILETLNIDRTIVIQGPLVPVLGRAAPGGIQNFITTRPSARDRNKFEAGITSQHRQRVSWESTGAVQAKRLWQRWAVDWSRKHGPEQFVHEDDLTVSGALTLKHSRAASSLVSVDYRRYDGNLTPGIPEYKTTAGQKVLGPYLPLAYFNSNGPGTGILRQSLVLGAQFEGQLTRALALRAAVEGWWRAIDQDRFTTSQLALDTGLLEGTREPRHVAQRQQALATHVELTGRFRTAGIEHKLLGYAGVTWGEYDRTDRALSIADRNALPVSVRHFGPAAPDYLFPAYTPELFSRMVTDRLETVRYTSLEVGDRAAFARGRTVVTAGLRLDDVELKVDDRKPGVALPRTSDRTRQLSFHSGVNYQLVRNRALLFASASTAFDPSTPVDARTGRIQQNETTLGYEGGLKGRAKAGRFDYSVSVFLLYNQHIARRNPLYNDPVFDANQTQPQLVAAGEERFTGMRADLRYKLTDTFTVAFRGVQLDAITTRSPALGAEVGRQMTRVPVDTATWQLRYASAQGAPGLSVSAALTYVGPYVANYEDARHAYLEYPGYRLLSLSTGYIWKAGPRQFTLGLSLRNALARDLVASNARVGAARELGGSVRMTF